MRIFRVLGVAALVLLIGYVTQNRTPNHKANDPDDPIIAVKQSDAKMNAAIAEAKAGLGTFIAALQHPKPGQDDFAVKMPFREGEEVEHMWVMGLSFDGQTFHGRLSNEPTWVKNVKMGQKVDVPRSEVSDWMWVENKKIVGGYTIRVLREMEKKPQ